VAGAFPGPVVVPEIVETYELDSISHQPRYASFSPRRIRTSAITDGARAPEGGQPPRRGDTCQTTAMGRDLRRHHAISDVRFGISIAQSRQSAFGQNVPVRSAPIAAGPGERARSPKRTPCRQNAIDSRDSDCNGFGRATSEPAPAIARELLEPLLTGFARPDLFEARVEATKAGV
jgi:hypothetical protein